MPGGRLVSETGTHIEVATTGEPRPLVCIRCAGPVDVAEDIEGVIDWGAAVIDADGVVRPADPHHRPPVVLADTGGPIGRPRACCLACGHQWRLRRPFDPTREPHNAPEPR